MQLILSTEAAPALSLEELGRSLATRGLAGLELVAGHAHGVSPSRLPAESSEIILAYRAATVAEAFSEGGARLSGTLGCPLIAPAAGFGIEALAEAVAAYEAAGGQLLLGHGSDAAEITRLQAMLEGQPPLVGLAWDVQVNEGAPLDARSILELAGPRLRYVRLHGGGPEAAMQEGMGVGALMARLALTRYAGPIALAPSDRRFHQAWAAWLGRGGGWGCGSKSSDASLVVLDP